MPYNQTQIAENRLMFGFTADEEALQKVEAVLDCRDSFAKQEVMWQVIHIRMNQLLNPLHNISDIIVAKDKWCSVKISGTPQEGFDIIIRIIKRLML